MNNERTAISSPTKKYLSNEIGVAMDAINGFKMEATMKSTSGSVLSAHNISYSVKVSTRLWGAKDEKQILTDITAVFKQGMTAVMGPTGSGKTTLLDIMATRKLPTEASGKILLDGRKVPTNFKCMVGYVVQNDTLMGTLSIRENLQFSAALRLPSTVSSVDRERRVRAVITELGLERCADTKVGTEFIRGVSGGERKRCNIGMELINSPAVLFLDEPTTGLDSDTAYTVLRFLKRLSAKGRTIVFTIHQPRYSIFCLFDCLLLLASGQIVFSGPSNEALEFFASQGFHCQIHNNPLDFFLDVINHRRSAVSEMGVEVGGMYTEKDVSQGALSQEALSQGALSQGALSQGALSQGALSQGALLVQGFKQSSWNRRLQEDAHAILSHYKAHGGMDGVRHDKVLYATPFYRQVSVLAARAFWNTLRSPQTIFITIGASVLLSSLLTAIYWRLKDDPISAFKDRSGVMFFMVMSQLFFNMPAVELFIKERRLFMHENASGFYRVSVYFLVKVLLDIIPLRTIPAVIMSIIIYFSIGLNRGLEQFFVLMGSLLCTTLAAAGMCFFVSASVHEFSTAQVILALVLMLMLLFGGFLVSFNSIGPWLNWVQYFSFFKYSLAALFINEFKDRQFCSNNYTICVTGNNYLREQQISFSEPWDLLVNHITLLSFAVIFLVLTYVQLRIMKKTS